MLSDELKSLIDAVLADGVITDKEREVLRKRAIAEGEDPDEVEILIEGQLAKMKKEQVDKISSAQQVKPQSNKKGNICKCPNCGAPVAATDVKCPECGYEFTGVEGNSSAQRLADSILEVRKRYANKSGLFGGIGKFLGQVYPVDPESNEIATVIKTFPIPNTKEDLLEFVITMKSNAKSQNEVRVIAEAYKVKYKECLQKIEIFFSEDPLFKPFTQKKGIFGKLFGK